MKSCVNFRDPFSGILRRSCQLTDWRLAYAIWLGWFFDGFMIVSLATAVYLSSSLSQSLFCIEFVLCSFCHISSVNHLWVRFQLVTNRMTEAGYSLV